MFIGSKTHVLNVKLSKFKPFKSQKVLQDGCNAFRPRHSALGELYPTCSALGSKCKLTVP